MSTHCQCEFNNDMLQPRKLNATKLRINFVRRCKWQKQNTNDHKGKVAKQEKKR